MTEEPYRWLEAIQNRREYIEDQLQTGAPVVAVGGDPGILIMTVKASTPKVFEVYDHLALGALGHPADLERVRQTAIDTAHVEGFARSTHDVSSRRLVSYSLGPTLKNAFEQIFAAPLMFRGIMAEVAADKKDDAIWVMDYDGTYSALVGEATSQGLVVGKRRIMADWEEHRKKDKFPGNSWRALADGALRLLAWARQPLDAGHHTDWPHFEQSTAKLLEIIPAGDLEIGLLERFLRSGGTAYRSASWSELDAKK